MTDAADRSNETNKGEGLSLRPPPGMHPVIARIIEALARDAARRDHQREFEAALVERDSPG